MKNKEIKALEDLLGLQWIQTTFGKRGNKKISELVLRKETDKYVATMTIEGDINIRISVENKEALAQILLDEWKTRYV